MSKIKNAVIFLITDDKHILILKNNYGNYGWSLPGGGLERKESVWQGALREFKEEVGYKLDLSKMNDIKTYDFYDSQPSTITRYFIVQSSQIFKRIRLSDEHTEYHFIKLSELKRIALNKSRKKYNLEYYFTDSLCELISNRII